MIGAPPPGEGVGVHSDDGLINIYTDEYSLVASHMSTGAGEVTFTLLNNGSESHSLVVIRTDRSIYDMPVYDNFVQEEQLDVVGKIEAISGGTTESLTVTLEPGKYLLMCNLRTHYTLSMRTSDHFVVE